MRLFYTLLLSLCLLACSDDEPPARQPDKPQAPAASRPDRSEQLPAEQSLAAPETRPDTPLYSPRSDLPAAPPATAPALPPPPAGDPVRIAIIIDDLGYHLGNGAAIARLPGPLTLAVLPHSPNGVALAELGHQRGKEIILHNPMSASPPRRLDPGGLTEDMGQHEFQDILQHNLASLPHIRGLNNHMGSQLTRLSEPMQWLMAILSREQLFFIDSRTSADSVAWDTARKFRVATSRRDVFLDNERTPAAIGQQFETLVRLARQRGSAIAIGHPYPETVDFLREILPTLPARGLELVPVSRLLPPPLTAAASAPTTPKNIKAKL